MGFHLPSRRHPPPPQARTSTDATPFNINNQLANMIFLNNKLLIVIWFEQGVRNGVRRLFLVIFEGVDYLSLAKQLEVTQRG